MKYKCICGNEKEINKVTYYPTEDGIRSNAFCFCGLEMEYVKEHEGLPMNGIKYGIGSR
jgi:hypothetical protein